MKKVCISGSCDQCWTGLSILLNQVESRKCNYFVFQWSLDSSRMIFLSYVYGARLSTLGNLGCGTFLLLRRNFWI